MCRGQLCLLTEKDFDGIEDPVEAEAEVRGGSVRLEQLVNAAELDLVVVHRALPDALVTVQGFRRLSRDVGISDPSYY